MTTPEPRSQLLGFPTPEMEGCAIVLALRTDEGFLKVSGRREMIVALARSILSVAGEMPCLARRRSPSVVKPVRRITPETLANYRKALAAWEAGGVTQAEACEKVRVRHAAFVQWLCRQRSKAAGVTPPASPHPIEGGGLEEARATAASMSDFEIGRDTENASTGAAAKLSSSSADQGGGLLLLTG